MKGRFIRVTVQNTWLPIPSIALHDHQSGLVVSKKQGSAVGIVTTSD